MCSISGGFSFNEGWLDLDFLTKLVKKGEKRGRDAFGIACPFLGSTQKYLSKPSTTQFEIPFSPSVVLINNRAEPTTEWVKNKSLVDVQPYSYKSVTIVHNGTIANDKELREQYQLPSLGTSIDSSVLPPLFYREWDGIDENKLITLLSQTIVGSFALAIYDQRNPQTLWLAVNYKPLTLWIDRVFETIYFSSLEEYDDLDDYVFDSTVRKIEVKPYTLLKIDREKRKIKPFSLYPPKEGKKKALVIASGGLDSTVAASWALHQHYSVELLHFAYGCKASSQELHRVEAIADFLKIPFHVIRADFFKDTIKHSRLFEENNLMTDDLGIKSAELAHEWVPARNLIFMSIAAGFAEAHNFDYIILGGNLEESGCLVNVEDNQVRMWDDSQKMPKDVQEGDELLGWNEDTQFFEKTIVQKVFTPIHKMYLILEFENGSKVQVSKEHPFFVWDVGWIQANNLFVLQEVKTQEGWSKVKRITTKFTPIQTYNYHCEPHNNFFINTTNILTHNSYPDNEYIFQKKFNELLPNALNLNSRVEVLTPVADLMKHEIVKLGLELGSPLHLSWSCYANGESPCGTCGPDFMRRTAFKMNGVKDMQAHDQDSDFWNDCQSVKLSEGNWVRD